MKQPMMSVTIILATTILTFTVFAQKKMPAFNPDSDAPDAVFVSASLRNLNNSRYVPDKQSEVSIKVRNIGSKIITSVEWEVRLEALLSYSESRKYSFRIENRDIKPGETKKLVAYMDMLITPNHKTAIVRIVRLEFSDRSMWEREKNEQ